MVTWRSREFQSSSFYSDPRAAILDVLVLVLLSPATFGCLRTVGVPYHVED